MQDFTPTKENITLHGLGFIQIICGDDARMHVWHPELPRRACFETSAVHNHRFGFISTVMKGEQVNVRCTVMPDDDGAYDLISHNGPRSKKGGRLSYVDGRCTISENAFEIYRPGDSYTMAPGEYHHTPNNGFVITYLRKTIETKIHANSTVAHGVTFDQSFDRFQFAPERLWGFVREAFEA